MGNEYCDYLIDLLSSWEQVSVKGMFGGWGLYRDGQIFGIVIDDTPYFKVGDANRADYEAAGAEPFSYMAKGKRVALSYWQLPGDILDDQDMLQEWAEKAYRVAQTAKALKKKPRSHRTASVAGRKRK